VCGGVLNSVSDDTSNIGMEGMWCQGLVVRQFVAATGCHGRYRPRYPWVGGCLCGKGVW